MKRLLDMTKRERRGTIVVLLLIAVILATTLLMRTRRGSAPVAGTDAVTLQAFETQTDSAVVTVNSPVRHKTDRKKSHKRCAAKKARPADKPRRLDPVPQFRAP